MARAADVPLAADLFHYMAGWATKIEGNTIDISVPYMPGANFHSYTLREPVGVVGQIIPWNFPLLMAAWKLGPALTTGNCVVLKPAEQTRPLVSEEQLQWVTGFLESGVAEGATTLTGGGRFGDNGYFVEPTVITNTRPDMKIVREEIFGPVVVAEPFGSLDEIAREANDTTYGLGAGIWTKDISKAHALAKKLRAGTVWINCYNVFDASLPFGGYKQSGWGREMGHEVLEAYTEVKAVTTQL